MKMKYKFNDEQQAKIKAARKANKNKHIDKRLEVLELRCKGISQKEISEKRNTTVLMYVTLSSCILKRDCKL